ncbi:MAG: TonB-dependent siderophore receptor [Gammaproteobacteria bacterium]|nr:TonB-dependent siderophore receptor [Gammaproteobacteria bacterium]MBU2121165.1 TonB-dependent siderophore receptor [Gammaproteobacteria bacterium]MBU2170189.1 TonB-dependent siderophore receptor [Gammaproteobacteria bacterium]MBU2202750.1 TonB-dependent siderophore receptor [Gammaproteobacteria bacterium]MBU2276489.1 TonB-dependent siderophore receptor [Gammaproteobacteria bacterium]
MHAHTPIRHRLNPLMAALLATLCGPALAQPTQPQTLGEVTVQSGANDDGYSPAASTAATKGSAPLRDVPQAVNVVPAQLLRDQGARSMEDALRNVPGVAMSHGDGQRDQVVIRGFTAIADQFVDGVRDDALYFRDLADIERIEVLKGPAAVLYGRGSSGGLINRVTKKPKFGETSGEATLGLGSFDFRRATADVNVGISDTAAFRINAAVEDSGSYRDQQFVKRHNFAPSLALKLAAQTDLLLQYTYARDKRLTDFGIPALNGRPVNVPASTYYGSSNAAQDDTTTSTMQSFAATLNHRFNAAWSVRNVTRLYDYALDRYNTLPSGTTDPVNMTVGRTRAFILRDEKGVFNQTDVTWRNRLGGLKQDWLMGMELGQQKKRSESVSGGADRVSIFNPIAAAPIIPAANYNADNAIPSHTTQDTAALYWQDQITLAPQWKALVGARYDVFKQQTAYDRKLTTLSRTDRKFSPRAGLVWQPSDTVSYYVSYSRSFQPSAEAFALSASNTASEPEITQNKEIGFKLDLLDGRMSITGALFNLERTNIKNSDPANPSRQINVGTQRTNGLELTTNGRLPGRWDVSAGYAWLDGRMTKSLATTGSLQSPTVAVPAQGKVAALTPRNSAFLWAMKDMGHGLRVGGGVNYVGARFTSLTNLVTLPSYTTLDAALQYTLGRWGVDVNIKNLTNRKYYVSAHGSNDNLILPGSPRALQVTLRTHF